MGKAADFKASLGYCSQYHLGGKYVNDMDIFYDFMQDSHGESVLEAFFCCQKDGDVLFFWGQFTFFCFFPGHKKPQLELACTLPCHSVIGC